MATTNETDWSSFKDLAPSQNVHAPADAPPPKAVHAPADAPPPKAPPSFYALAQQLPSPNSPPASALSPASDQWPLQAPEAHPTAGTYLAPAYVHTGATGEEKAEGGKSPRQRVLERLERDAEEEEKRGRGRGEMKSVGLGLGLELGEEGEERKGEKTVEEALSHPASGHPLPSPPPSPSSLSPSPTSFPHATDHSIPLTRRLAGKAEVMTGKVLHREGMVRDGRIRAGGVGVEAVGGGDGSVGEE
ncbi:hypothetical protein JCM8097_003471 [Rhodosporidiobolus ruineniae]